jgi:hypothetical protein
VLTRGKTVMISAVVLIEVSHEQADGTSEQVREEARDWTLRLVAKSRVGTNRTGRQAKRLANCSHVSTTVSGLSDIDSIPRSTNHSQGDEMT